MRTMKRRCHTMQRHAWATLIQTHTKQNIYSHGNTQHRENSSAKTVYGGRVGAFKNKFEIEGWSERIEDPFPSAGRHSGVITDVSPHNASFLIVPHRSSSIFAKTTYTNIEIMLVFQVFSSKCHLKVIQNRIWCSFDKDLRSCMKNDDLRFFKTFRI